MDNGYYINNPTNNALYRINNGIMENNKSNKKMDYLTALIIPDKPEPTESNKS